jgi:cell division protein FtsW
MTRKLASHVPFTWQANSAGLGLMLATLSLLALGVVMVHSAVASVAEPGLWYARRDVRHTIFALGAVLVLLGAWRLDYRRLVGRRRVPILPACLLAAALLCALLVYVPTVGRAVGGKYRWIRIGPAEYGIGFQPSELIKLAVVVFLAGWLTRRATDVRSFRRTFLPAMLLTLVCVGLVVREDLGMAALIGAGAVATMFLAGVPWHYLLTLLPPAAGGFYVFVVRDPERWRRITAMIDPWCTSNPSAYHARQSLLAVMTGGYFGRGLGHGMLKRGYLPEGPTDFIFSVFCEEWGLLGALLLVGLVLMWMWHARRAALRAGDDFGRTLAGSLGFLIAFQAVLHIAVDLVAAPPTGIGCPFVSAGGTRLIATAVATALILSVTAHRPTEAIDAPTADAARARSVFG